MVQNGLRAVIAGALITIGALAPARAAPIAPTAMMVPVGPSVQFVSFWGRPFPYGYAYYPAQCYTHVQVETPGGYVWRRVFICTETGVRGYGDRGRF